MVIIVLFQYFENVTVMFSYLDGFVAICSQVSAMEIVSLVNSMFTTLDKLTEKARCLQGNPGTGEKIHITGP